MKTRSELEIALAQKQKELSALRAEYELLGDRVYAAAVAYDALQDTYHLARLEEAQAHGGALDWPYLLAEGQGMAHYRSCQAALDELGLESAGYYQETQQRCVRIRLFRHKPEQPAQIAKSLAILLPHLIPVRDDWCWISISDHRLSENGSYSLWLKKDGCTARCVHTRYGRETILVEADNLLSVLQYVQANCYYD